MRVRACRYCSHLEIDALLEPEPLDVLADVLAHQGSLLGQRLPQGYQPGSQRHPLHLYDLLRQPATQRARRTQSWRPAAVVDAAYSSAQVSLAGRGHVVASSAPGERRQVGHDWLLRLDVEVQVHPLVLVLRTRQGQRRERCQQLRGFVFRAPPGQRLSAS